MISDHPYQLRLLTTFATPAIWLLLFHVLRIDRLKW